MKRYYLLLCFLLFVFSSFAQEWKRVETDMYSVEIPESWPSEQGNNTPRVVDVKSRNFRQYSIYWFSPESESPSTWAKSMHLCVESYTGLNGSVLPFSVVEDMAIDTPTKVLNIQREEIGKGKVRLTILEESMQISLGKIKRHNVYRYILLLQDRDFVHEVTVDIREKYLKEEADKLKDIERILNSFEVK